jgi:hypothetical protein
VIIHDKMSSMPCPHIVKMMRGILHGGPAAEIRDLNQQNWYCLNELIEQVFKLNSYLQGSLFRVNHEIFRLDVSVSHPA